jgi:archaemetzincin
VNRIHILPLGNADRELVSKLRDPLSKTFAVPVDIDEASLDIRRFYDPARGQYNSTSILQHLRAQPLSSRTLAVTNEDLFIPILTYVFGEAELLGKVAVISYHRLQPERYGLPSNPPLLLERTCKEAAHELGHAYGLVHCSLQECVMHTSTYVEEIDMKGPSFCPSCRETIRKSSNLR